MQNHQEKSLVELIVKLHDNSTIKVGNHSINAEIRFPQGSFLSPVLFNLYLEEALKISQKLEKVRRRGGLMVFADDMLVMSNSHPEIEMIVNELAKLQKNGTCNWKRRSLKSSRMKTLLR
jgi:hypothetical protein